MRHTILVTNIIYLVTSMQRKSIYQGRGEVRLAVKRVGILAMHLASNGAIRVSKQTTEMVGAPSEGVKRCCDGGGPSAR